MDLTIQLVKENYYLDYHHGDFNDAENRSRDTTLLLLLQQTNSSLRNLNVAYVRETLERRNTLTLRMTLILNIRKILSKLYHCALKNRLTANCSFIYLLIYYYSIC